jgi:hypothetical protein
LTVSIPLVLAAVVGGIRALGVEQATDPAYVVAGLGVTAFAVISLGVVSAADILGRAYVEAVHRAPAEPAESVEDKHVNDARLREDRAGKRSDKTARTASRERGSTARIVSKMKGRDARTALRRRGESGRIGSRRRGRSERIANDVVSESRTGNYGRLR